MSEIELINQENKDNKVLTDSEKQDLLRVQHANYFYVFNLESALTNLDFNINLLTESLSEIKDMAQAKVCERLRSNDFETAIKYAHSYRYISMELNNRLRVKNNEERIRQEGENGSFSDACLELSPEQMLEVFFGIESKNIDFENESDLICEYVNYFARVRLDCGKVCDHYYLKAAKKVIENIEELKNINKKDKYAINFSEISKVQELEDVSDDQHEKDSSHHM